MLKKGFCSVILAPLVASTALADTIQLKDKATVTGTILAEKRDQVSSISATPSSPSRVKKSSKFRKATTAPEHRRPHPRSRNPRDAPTRPQPQVSKSSIPTTAQLFRRLRTRNLHFQLLPPPSTRAQQAPAHPVSAGPCQSGRRSGGPGPHSRRARLRLHHQRGRLSHDQFPRHRR